jgi:valyl-tRNA synthetase
MDKNFPTNSQEIINKWLNQKIYKFNLNSSKPHFTIDTPPPTVSGSLHIGHIFSYTQTDVIARFKKLDGFNVFYPFGCDDNGLPTEKFVEKKTGVSPHKVGATEFIKLCEKEVIPVEENFKTLWQKMGLSIDWDLTYTTISPVVRKLSQLSFLRLFKQNDIYRRQEPALYCVTCHTTVAQAELDDAEKPSMFYTIKFKDSSNNDILIATTRPELLTSCVAVMVNPNDNRYKHLIGSTVKTCYFNVDVPVIADEKVMLDKGTGLVMCCTFGDKTDIEWFKKHNLAYKPSFDAHGKWLDSFQELGGLKTKAAREKIVEILKNNDLITQETPIQHNVNIHERCKNEIEYLIIPQWFLKTIQHKNDLLKVADKIEWQPSFMKSRYQNWVENLSWDWCLSRQRFFGIPFPVWHCTKCHEMILADEDKLPISPQEIGDIACPKCLSIAKPDTDVMDTWNTSSLTPQICQQLIAHDVDVFQSSSFIPMSMRPQAHDIIRTWAFYTIIKSWLHFKREPWSTITISGHVLSSQKDKISKSQGNTPTDPDKLLGLYPADAIRYWTASGSLGHDMAFNETQFKIGLKLLTKIWNAFKFIDENTKNSELKLNNTIDFQNLDTCNSYLLSKISQTFKEYKNLLNQGEFGLALEKLEKLFWHDFCDNHIELIKDQFLNSHKYQKSNTDQILLLAGLQILQMYAPYIPFITENIFSEIYNDRLQIESVHLTNFNDIQLDYQDENASKNMKLLQSIVDAARKLKTNNQLSLKTEIENLTIFNISQKFIDEHFSLICGITKAKNIIVKHADGETNADELVKNGETYDMHINL